MLGLGLGLELELELAFGLGLEIFGAGADGSEQTQTAMEHWNIANVRAAIEEGKLKSPVPEQADMK